MRDYLTIGSAPCEENCVMVSKDEPYLGKMRTESLRFIEAIRKKLGPEKGSARLGLKTFPHDFGEYVEVICSFDVDDQEGVEYAYLCESDLPSTWADVEPIKEDLYVHPPKNPMGDLEDMT